MLFPLRRSQLLPARRLWTSSLLLALGGVSLGCSDPAPPPSQGGVSYRVTNALSSDTPPGYACPALPHEVGIGSPPPNATTGGGRAIDGENGAEITCRVGGGTLHSFSATLRKSNVSFTIKGSVENQGKGEATVFAFDPQTSGTLTNDPNASTQGKPCEVSTEADLLSAREGKLFASFTCPAVEVSGQPNTLCRLTEGYLILEECD